MIVRTPPAKRSRGPPEVMESGDCPLVVPSPPADSHPLLCTYQCRQMVKADVLDALANAEKQVAEYETKLDDLNSRFSQADVERKRVRDQLMYAQQELAAARGREHTLQEQLLKDVNDSQEQFKKQVESYSKLEVKLANERNLREKAESTTASAEQKVSELEGKLGNLCETIEREKKRLNRELLQLQQESKSSISRIKVDLEKMECRANHAEKESEMLNNELEDMRIQLEGCLNQKSELEKKLLGLSYQEGSSTESNILVKHLQDDLRKYESEVREARKLKSTYEGIEILNEKLLEEKSRRERAEADLSRLQSVELHMSTLEEELSSWKSIANNIPGVSCSDDIPMKFAALQKEMIDNMTKLGETTVRLKQLEVALGTAQLDKQNVETEAAILKEKEEALKHDMKKMNLLISTVTIEKDALRQVVEELKRSKSDQSGKELTDGNILRGLEFSLSQKESCIKELESEINEAKMVSHRGLQEIELLNERLDSEARRIKSLERENDRLLQQISLLESKLGHGDFSAANTKVLRMVNTLALDNEAKETIEALQTALQKAKEKLDAVEELTSQSGDAGMLVDSFISGKITQLKEQIATLEKREERYKTVFADRISVFRKACCELFGYKIIMDEQHRANGIPVTLFTLQSIYAQGDNEKLEFEYESGNTNILANKYTSQPEVSRQVDIFVRRMNSIPAFTANLTVESFNKRTLS